MFIVAGEFMKEIENPGGNGGADKYGSNLFAAED